MSRGRILRASVLGACLISAGCAPSLQQVIRDANTKVPDSYGVAQPEKEGVAAGSSGPQEKAQNPEPKSSSPEQKTANPEPKSRGADSLAPDTGQKSAASVEKATSSEQKAASPDQKTSTPEPKPASTDPKTSSSEQKAAPVTSAKIDWKEFFHDDGLATLIDLALNKNQELAILQQEVSISKNEILARSGEYLPKLGLVGGAGVAKVGKLTSQGASDAANGLKEDLPNLLLGLSASWEIDIWRKLRNATQVALLRYLASVDGRNFAVTRLVAEVAENYYELMGLYKKVEILKQNIALQQKALDMVRIEKIAARVTELAVKRFEAEVLKNQSRMYGLKQKIIEKENRLNFLAGRFPQQIELNSTDFIQLTPKAVEAGVPSQLLENRPDVKQAELSLKAAKLNVDVARARFYPSFNIEAGAGFQSFNANHLFVSPESLFYNIAGNLAAPLLNRRGIKADYYSAGAKQMQAVYDFERTILRAYTEVVNQLNMVENLKSTFELKSQQVEKLTDSIEISDTLFKAARCDYMEVLFTRRDALEAQMDLVEVKQQQLSAVITLYQALGGGWKQQ